MKREKKKDTLVVDWAIYLTFLILVLMTGIKGFAIALICLYIYCNSDEMKTNADTSRLQRKETD